MNRLRDEFPGKSAFGAAAAGRALRLSKPRASGVRSCARSMPHTAPGQSNVCDPHAGEGDLMVPSVDVVDGGTTRKGE